MAARSTPRVATMKRIPISAGRLIADTYGYDQVVIIARKVGEGGGEHCTTYGVDKVHCGVAARVGRFLTDKVMGWSKVVSDGLRYCGPGVQVEKAVRQAGDGPPLSLESFGECVLIWVPAADLAALEASKQARFIGGRAATPDEANEAEEEEDEQRLAWWQEGYNAFKAGWLYSGCPHPAGEARIQWQEGWAMAKVDKETA